MPSSQRPSSPSEAPSARPSTFESFCQTTSLHGWRFLAPDGEQYSSGGRGQGRGQRRRLLTASWGAVVLGSIGVAVFFLSNSLVDFLSSTVQTTQDTSR